MHTLATILISSFVMGTSASPSNPMQTRGGSTCLAVLLTLLLLLLFLVISKRIFMKHRRIPPAILGSSSTLNTSLHSLASKLPPSNGIRHNSGYEKGVLVGIFGSPSWETRPERLELCHQPRWEGIGNTCADRSHTGSQRLKASPDHRPSSTVIGVAQSCPVFTTRSTVNDACIPYKDQNLAYQKPCSSNLLARPSRIYAGFNNTRNHRTTTCRFSLPATREKYNQICLLDQRSESFSSASTLPFPANPSLRLIESNDKPDLPLPLSPEHQWGPFPSSPQEFAKPLTQKQDIPSVSPKTPTVVTTGPFPLRISHPYPLTPGKPENKFRIRTFPDGEIPHDKIIQVTNDCIHSPDTDLLSRADCQSPFVGELSTQVTSSYCNPLTFQTSFTGSLAHSVPYPYPPLRCSNVRKVTHKQNISIGRARRSPPIGPSPLRSMILPESFDTTLATRQALKEINVNETDMNHHLTSLETISLKVTPSPKGQVENLYETSTAADRVPQEVRNKHLPVRNKNPDILLEIIRELAEETNDWDASLFMDENFKAMINGSGAFPSRQEIFNKYNPAPTDLLPACPDGVDIGSAGIDVFENHDQEWVNCKNKSDDVGLAW